MLVHLSSSGLLALVFSGSGEVAWRFWPEKHAIYKLHTGVYVGDVGGRIVSCHDGDAVLWNIQKNEAYVHGLFQGHRADIVKVRLELLYATARSLDHCEVIRQPEFASFVIDFSAPGIDGMHIDTLAVQYPLL